MPSLTENAMSNPATPIAQAAAARLGFCARLYDQFNTRLNQRRCLPVRTACASGTPRPARRQAGVSVVESLVTVATATATLSTAIPNFEKARVQRHLEGAATQLETDIHLARSQAVALHHNLRLSLINDEHGSGYIIHTGKAGSCTLAASGAASCGSNGSVTRSVRLPKGGAVQLQSNVGSIVFQGDKGTSTPTGTLKLQADNNRAVHVVVNVMGRVRACTPNVGTVSGYAKC
jgi:type IV fimbrial biogenesis protein FimT